MKTLFIIITLICVTTTTHATSQFMEHDLCKWMATTASVIAQNKKNGMSEIELIANYLKQNESYMEQSIVISLIDRIYSVKHNQDADQIAYLEQQRCGLEMAKSAIDHSDQYALRK